MVRGRTLALRPTCRHVRQRRPTAPRTLLSALAQQLYLLNAALEDLDAGVASDAFVAVEAMAGDTAKADDAWPLALAQMYERGRTSGRCARRCWSDGAQQAGALALLMAVSGLGAHAILRRESGLHVFETTRHRWLLPAAVGARARHAAAVQTTPVAAVRSGLRACLSRERAAQREQHRSPLS